MHMTVTCLHQLGRPHLVKSLGHLDSHHSFLSATTPQVNFLTSPASTCISI